jgi:NAD+ synthase
MLPAQRWKSGRSRMSTSPSVWSDVLHIDAAAETERIVEGIRSIVLQQLKRGGAVIGVSGGIDSSVVAFLCARALGKERVLALFTPETESSTDNLRLGRSVAQALGVRFMVEDVTSILKAAQCYKRRDEAVRRVVPEFGCGYRCRIVLPSVHDPQCDALFSVVVEAPDGQAKWVRLNAETYSNIVAAASFKERARKMMEYYYADLLQYAVVGTPNRLEYDQGLFVKNGDGAADIKPIAHLYKSQVYQLAAYLGVPGEIRRRPPTTNVYPLEQSQEESYFMLSLQKMDFCLYGKNNGIPAADLGSAVGLDTDQVQRVYDAIQAKRNAAQYLRAAPMLVGEVSEV